MIISKIKQFIQGLSKREKLKESTKETLCKHLKEPTLYNIDKEIIWILDDETQFTHDELLNYGDRD